MTRLRWDRVWWKVLPPWLHLATRTRPGALLAPVLVALTVLLSALTALADEPDQDSVVPLAHAAALAESAPVIIDGKTLLLVRGVAALPAEERADAIAGRISDLAADSGFSPDDLVIVELDDRSEFRVGERMIFTLVDEDAQLEGVHRKTLAEVCLPRLRAAIVDYRADRDPTVLFHRALLALTAAGALTLLLGVILWAFRRLVAALERSVKRSAGRVRIQRFQLLRPQTAWAAVLGLARLLRIAVVVVVVLTFTEFALGLFPWTRLLALEARGHVLGPLARMGEAIVEFIPDLLFLATLALVTRYVLRGVHVFFQSVERGSVKLSGFEAEWSWPTYRIVRLLVIVFAVIVAFPYLPGSESGAFRGISLFLGVIFSLGSTSVISNIVAGYTMTYRRAFRVGERIRVGDVVGDVLEMRLLVTHIRTRRNEEVVVPNSMILNQQIVNYSSLAKQHGLIVHTRVGIGYEVPWRQVEALLLRAAYDTPGALEAPAPFVLQERLGDFAVEYELNVACRDPHQMLQMRTELHRRVLDVFNEHGIAIMTPAYVADPSVPKTVPREHWFDPPATANTEGPAAADASE